MATKEFRRIVYEEMTEADIKFLDGCFFGSTDDEEYTYMDIDDAIGDMLYEVQDAQAPELVVVAARHTVLTADNINYEEVVNSILEGLDDDYGDPNGGFSKPTEAMLTAAKHLCEVIAKEYEPYACDAVAEIVVKDPAKWIKDNG